MPQLDPTWYASQLFWLFICFVALYVVLARVILPPIMGIVGQRKQTLEQNIAQAEKFRAEAAHAQQDYERALGQSREMAQALINEVLEENKKHAEKTMHSLDAEIAKKLKEASTHIEGKKHELFATLTPAAAEFAGMIAEKITQKPVSNERASGAVLNAIKTKGSL